MGVLTVSKIPGYRKLSSKDKEELKKFTRFVALITKRRAEAGVNNLLWHEVDTQAYKEIYGEDLR